MGIKRGYRRGFRFRIGGFLGFLGGSGNLWNNCVLLGGDGEERFG